MMRRPILLSVGVPALAILVVVAYLAFEPGGSPSGGPLQDRFDELGRYQACGSSTRADTYSFGDGFDNVADEPITVNSVTVESIDGITLIEVVRPPAHAAIGAVERYPPSVIPAKAWERAVPAEGFVLDAGEYTDVVLGVKGRRGKATGLVVRYELDGRQYEAVKNSGYVIRPKC
jgi:hypothetical protein